MTQQSEGQVIWFTGLSGSGKTTLCRGLSAALESRGHRVQILDGDDLRRKLCVDLGFDDQDRSENVRRVACVADLFAKAGTTVLVALITPLERLRSIARSKLPTMIEVFVHAPLAVCEKRDPKGLYQRARSGNLQGFTGIDSLFEPPTNPDLVCYTDRETVEESLEKVLVRLNRSEEKANRSQHRRVTIAVDFDGVIAEYDGWKGAGVLGAPRQDVLTALHALRAEGWKIIVHSTRGVEELSGYLLEAGVPFDEINTNSDYSTQSAKPVATVYWDDRAVTYSGDARRDLETIRAFRTWNNRP